MSANGPPPDHVVPDPEPAAEAEDPRLADNLTSRSTWLRLLFMILFMVLWGVSRLVILAVIVVQFCWVLISGRTNPRLIAFGLSLAMYSYQIVAYLTFNTEDQPFPFADWPTGAPGDASTAETAED